MATSDFCVKRRVERVERSLGRVILLLLLFHLPSTVLLVTHLCYKGHAGADDTQRGDNRAQSKDAHAVHPLRSGTSRLGSTTRGRS
jgi:hypothetical protein